VFGILYLISTITLLFIHMKKTKDFAFWIETGICDWNFNTS